MANVEKPVSERVRETIAIGLTVYDNKGEKVGKVENFDRDTGYMTVRFNPFPEKVLYIPVRLITNIDPRELYLSLSRDELHRDYAHPPPRSTRIQVEYGLEVAVTTEPSGYDGRPVVVQRAAIDDLKKAIAVGDRVLTSDLTELGTITQYDPTKASMWVARDVATAWKDPALEVSVTLVDVVDRDTQVVYLVSSEADLQRMERIKPAYVISPEADGGNSR
jgi:hypothetical protein